MKPFSELSGRPLTWIQKGALHAEHELRAGDEVVATLQWPKALGTLALAVTAESRWTLKRAGFLRPRVTVRSEGHESDLAVYTPAAWRDGAVVFADGRRYFWTHVHFWRGEWAFTTDAEFPVVTFRTHHGLLKASAEVEIAPTAPRRDDVPLLTVLGWYLLALMAQDTAVATAAAGSMG